MKDVIEKHNERRNGSVKIVIHIACRRAKQSIPNIMIRSFATSNY